MKAILAVLLLSLFCQTGLASVRLTPIYANEASNWPLETFAANGLFRQIARYQRGHPQAIVLNGGDYDLAKLAGQLDSHALSRTESGWILHYPLVIGPGTRLNLINDDLFIEGRHGGCLINRGELVITNSHLASNGNQNSGFIHGWGGSVTRIQDSTLNGLGRADYRANGISVARHRYQSGAAAAQLYLANNQLQNLYRGVDAEPGSRVQINDLSITDSREQGVVLQNSPARIERLQIYRSSGHGLRAEGSASLVMSEIDVGDNQGSGVLLENHTGPVQISQLRSSNNLEYGVQIKAERGKQATTLQALVLRDNGSDGLRLDGSMEVTLEQADISTNQRYAIAIQSSQRISATLSQLRLHHNRLAALQTNGEGELLLNGISLRHNSNQGKYLAGNLAAREAELLPPLLRGQTVAVEFTEALPTIPLANLR
ncbi:right-handed parallel beta-helix repeat-containing protein [Alcanivorax sp. DP30]|uniref:right-handed parallel beta-helix repeat-containing protein n=1 Tax=Alcanivorax sp. DP30 TaxID=2606217 RepID=UPI0013712AE1|nr:right-handed parallel beta-helix repeat-containing protein [Alcanivorax sp. DP30]MZR61277.1 right-handed parallel beta-helix repeat-containing protein [Alcanivorax sp. DP30]